MSAGVRAGRTIPWRASRRFPRSAARLRIDRTLVLRLCGVQQNATKRRQSRAISALRPVIPAKSLDSRRDVNLYGRARLPLARPGILRGCCSVVFLGRYHEAFRTGLFGPLSLCAIRDSGRPASRSTSISPASAPVNSSSGRLCLAGLDRALGLRHAARLLCAYSLQRMHYSRKYHMSPMPHSIFFPRRLAIHGTHAVGALGRPASLASAWPPAMPPRSSRMVAARRRRISISVRPGRYYAAGGKESRHFARSVRFYGKKTYVASRRSQTPMASARQPRAATAARTWQARSDAVLRIPRRPPATRPDGAEPGRMARRSRERDARCPDAGC